MVLRALDTVEDDPNFDKERKIPLLKDFHNKIQQPGFTVKNCGQTKDYRDLLENFDRVIDVYLNLKPK